MEWNGMKWNGMEWNEMEWNGIIDLGVCVFVRKEYKDLKIE
jgi:hypothetical protein